MNTVFKSIIIVASFWSWIATAGTPELMPAPVEKVFAPAGFDSNDNVEIVVTGHLPNLCHKSPQASATVEGMTVKVEIKALYYSEENPFCPEMVVPFVQKVSLGVMPEGDYRIVVNEKEADSVKTEMSVSAAAAASVDTHHYAYVEYIERDLQSRVVELKGYHLSDCFALDKIESFHNGKDVYSILPIMKKTSGFCPRKLVPFSYRFKVPVDLDRREVLLHVRTLNGNSVNAVFVRPEKPVPLSAQ